MGNAWCVMTVVNVSWQSQGRVVKTSPLIDVHCNRASLTTASAFFSLSARSHWLIVFLYESQQACYAACWISSFVCSLSAILASFQVVSRLADTRLLLNSRNDVR